MSTPNFPATLPGMSMRNYSLKPTNNIIRTEMEAGPARTRRRYISAPTEVTVQWRFSLDELEIFQTFYRDTIFDGAGWFNIKVVDGRGEGTYLARFREPYQATTEAREYLWTVNATLEVMF